MHRKILTIALAVLALAVAASPALAAKAPSHHKSPHRYALKRGHHCRKHYMRVRHGHKVYCVKRRTKAAPKKAPPASQTAATPVEKVTLHAHLDPTFVRNPLDPFEVRYAYSASATQTAASTGTMSLATTEAPAPLPPGVLSLYSDGKLECAINVGSGVEGSECPVTYQALGEHRVTTLYTSGEQSATETEVEQIGPLATTTTLSVSFVPHAPEKVDGGLWWIGDLDAKVSTTPTGRSAMLGCGEGSIDHLTPSGCYQITGETQHVYANPIGSCSAPELGALYIAETPSSAGSEFSAASLEAGAYHLRASVVAGGGYSASETTALIQFTPEVTFPPDC